MAKKKSAPVTRREFMAKGGAALATTAVASTGMPLAGANQRRVALVGTGWRGSLTWGRGLLRNYTDVTKLVGLCDINGKRVEASKKFLKTDVPTFVDFDRMVKETKPDTVVVTTPDATHYRYIVRGLELGCNVVTEKPMCTDEEQCQAILDAEKKSDKKVTVGFNARHDPDDMRIKGLVQEGAIGKVLSMQYDDYLDTAHGASYFRRWHRFRENSGTLLVHKASHHFDEANWWIDSDPVDVVAFGDLKFYGRNNSFRSTHCRACPFKKECKFYWDIEKAGDLYVKLYTDCESEDGYLRDGCLWNEGINIYDTMSVLVRYENGAQLTWTGHTYQPYEGVRIALTGTTGRLDYSAFGGGGYEDHEVRLTRSFGKSEVVKDIESRLEGGHGGADTSLMNWTFRKPKDTPDPLNLRADLRAGALSSLIGIAAYKSIERNGQRIKIADLVKF